MALSNPTDILGLRVACMNVRGIMSDSKKRGILHDWLIRNRIDIVLLQEVCVHHENKNNKFPIADFKGYLCNKNSKCKEVKILWKDNINILIPKLKRKKYKNGMWIEWISLVNDKKVINFASFYYSPNKKFDNLNYNPVKKDIELLYDLFNNKECYICINGDFNSKSTQWGNITDDRGIKVMDWTTDMNLDIVNLKQPTHRCNDGSTTAIDLTIVSDNLRPMVSDWHTNEELNAKHGQIFDHFGLIFTIDFDPSQIKDPLVISYNLNPNDIQLEQYQDAIEEELNDWDKYITQYWDDPNDFEFICDDFTERIKYGAIKCLGVKRYHKNSKNWINSATKRLIRKRQELRKAFSGFKNRTHKYARKIKRKINQITHKIATKKARYFRKFNKNVAARIEEATEGDSKLLHQLYGQATNDPTPPIPPQMKDGKIVALTVPEIANHLHKHFNRTIVENDYEDEHKEFHKLVHEQMQTYERQFVNEDNILNRAFNEQEVIRTINTANKNSAMGIDRVHMKLIYFAKNQISPHLCKLWNYMYVIHGRSPYSWKFSDIFPIPKPGRDNSITKNNRPISLLPMMARLFEKAIANRVVTWCIKHDIIKPWNCAFQPNKATEDVMGALAENVIRNFHYGSMTEVDFMDLDSAYDTVWREGIIYKCIQYGMDGNFISFLKSYFEDRWNRVTFGDYSTDWMESNVGLPQGGPMMPILFTLYINDFEFNPDSGIGSIELCIAAFADDLTIYILPCPYTIDVVLSTQNGINDLYWFTRKWRLVMSTVKCNSISLSRSPKLKAHVYQINEVPMDCVHAPANAPDICCHSKVHEHVQLAKQLECKTDRNDKNLSLQESFKLKSKFKLGTRDPHSIPLWVRILGLYFDPKLTWKPQIDQIVNRVKQKLHQLQRITYSPRFKLPTKTVWKLYQSTIRPIMEYGLCIYGTNNKHIEKLDQLQNQALRIAFKAKKSTNYQYLKLFLDTTTMEERLDRIRIKFWAKLIRSHQSLLPNDTFNRWLDFANDNKLYQHFRETRNRKLAPRFQFDKAKKVSESPIAKAYETIDKIVTRETEIPFEFEPQFYKSPPCYDIQFPENIEMFESLELYWHSYSGYESNILQGWTDGSCKPNPGPAGASVYFPQMDDLLSRDWTFDFETTINHAEIVAIRLAFESIWDNFDSLEGIDTICIFTDSLFCFKLFTKDSYPKLRLYYDELMIIYEIINELQEYFDIKFIKVASHTEIEENEEVDDRANDAADQAIEWQKYGDLWHPELTPAIVDIQKYNSLIKEFYNNKRKEYFDELYSKVINKQASHHEFKSYFMIDTLFDSNANFKENIGKLFSHEMKKLNGNKVEMICKLRSEHISLNGYARKILGKPSDRCPHCLCIETVEHFVMDCRLFDEQRSEMRKKLININNEFDNESFFNIRNVLFPHEWVRLPDPKSENYKDEWNEATNTRVRVLQLVTEFVNDTNRFKQDEIL